MKLNDTYTYLIGPMEFAADEGVGWRTKFTNLIEQNGLNITILDPTSKPEGLGVTREVETIKELREQRNWPELVDRVKNIRRVDLRCVDVSDFLVAHIDKNIHMCGSYNEIFVAEVQRKPILVYCKEGIEGLPSWLLGAIRLDEVFTTINDLVDRLIDIDNGTIEMDKRWVPVKTLTREAVKNERI